MMFANHILGCIKRCLTSTSSKVIPSLYSALSWDPNWNIIQCCCPQHNKDIELFEQAQWKATMMLFEDSKMNHKFSIRREKLMYTLNKYTECAFFKFATKIPHQLQVHCIGEVLSCMQTAFKYNYTQNSISVCSGLARQTAKHHVAIHALPLLWMGKRIGKIK